MIKEERTNMFREIKLRKILREGKVAIGTGIYSNSPTVVELAGFCGLDFIRIDNEHGWRRDESMENMMRAATIAGITPIIRVDKGDPFLVRKALEVGAEGLVIPHIESKAEVEELVQAAKFPPRGIRGKGSQCFSARWGTVSDEEWMNWSDNEVMIGVMIETEVAVANLDQIMSTEGLDWVLFGPGDYSVSIGLKGTQRDNPKVQQAIQETINMGRKYDIPVAFGVAHPWDEQAKKYIAMGCRMIEVGHDLSDLKSLWTRLATGIQRTP